MHQIEIFSAGSAVCEAIVALIRRVATEGSEVAVLDVRDAQVAARARTLGLRSFPAVVLDGEALPFDVFASLSRLADQWSLLDLIGDPQRRA